MSGAVLILRPQPGADETVALLMERGIDARPLPILEIAALPETPALRALVQRLAEFDLVLFTSPAAVRCGMKWIDANWPQYPLAVEWLAVGARTAELLRDWGIEAASPATEESAEGLLEMELLARSPPPRVLIVRGEGGREVLGEALAARGARVEHLIVYRRVARVVTLPPPREIAALVASSGDGVDALVASDGLRAADRPLIVPSERVARRAREAGFAQVRVADGAGPEATRMALAAIGIVSADQAHHHRDSTGGGN